MHDNIQILKSPDLTNPKLAESAYAIFNRYKLTIILMALVLWAIGVPVELMPNSTPWAVLGSNLSQEILGVMFFIYLISADVSTKVSATKILLTLLCYFLVWLLSNLHTIVILLEAPVSVVTPAIGVATVLTLYLLVFYFFFIPYLTSNLDLISSFRSASSIVSAPRILAIRIISTALIVSLLIRQTFQFFKLPSINVPQDFTVIFDLLSTFSQPAYWMISTLLCIGTIQITSPVKLNQTNYLNCSSKGIIYFLLGGAGIGKILLSVLLLGAGSVYLTLTAPPDFSATAISSNYDKDNKLFSVDLHIQSTKGTLANLQPMFFRIAGEDAYPFSEVPSKIEPTQSISAIASGASEVSMKLYFQIINRQDDFDKLEDKALWYLNHKIVKID